MYIIKIFRNFALFALFTFNYQSRPKIFWRHSPLTFYIYNFNPIFNLIQKSELNYQFARNVQIKLNWIELGSIQSQLFELLRALSTRANCPINASYGWRGRALVRPSAGISVVRTQLTWIRLSWISWRSQCRWISMCLNLILSFGVSFFRKLIVYWLSYEIVSLYSGSSLIDWKSRFHQKISFVVYVWANNLDSVLKIVIVFYFVYL